MLGSWAIELSGAGGRMNWEGKGLQSRGLPVALAVSQSLPAPWETSGPYAEVPKRRFFQ